MQSKSKRLQSANNREYSSELEWLIFHLWSKPTIFNFRIPETIILKTRLVRGVGKEDKATLLDNWYFSASQGYILKKNRHNVTVHKLKTKLQKGLNQNFQNAAATAYHYDIQDPDEAGSGKKDVLTLEHIPTHDVGNFCQMLEDQLQYPRKRGLDLIKLPQIIQKFVYSQSSKNQMLKVVWKKQDEEAPFTGEQTPENIILMERGYNINSMYDTKLDINDRCHTFEALGANAQRSLEKMISSDQNTKRSAASVPLSLFNDKSSAGRLSNINKKTGQQFSVCTVDRDIPDVIQGDLRDAVYQIKDHLYHECGLDLLKCTFYFKYDKANVLYLVYAAGIQAIEHTVKTNEEKPTTESGEVKQTESLAQVNKFGFHPLLRTVQSTIKTESKDQLQKNNLFSRFSLPTGKLSGSVAGGASDNQQILKAQQMNQGLKPQKPHGQQRAQSGKYAQKNRNKLNYDIAEFDNLHAFQIQSQVQKVNNPMDEQAKSQIQPLNTNSAFKDGSKPLTKILKRPQSGVPMKTTSQLPLIEEHVANSPGKSEQQMNNSADILSCLDPRLCPFCLKQHQSEDQMIYEFSIDFIVKIYQNLLQFENYQQFLEDNMKQRGQFISEIPEALLRMFPQLRDIKNQSNYQKNPIFMYRKVKVCDDCFVNLNDIQQVQQSNNYQLKMGGDRDKQIWNLTEQQLRFIKMIQSRVDSGNPQPLRQEQNQKHALDEIQESREELQKYETGKFNAQSSTDNPSRIERGSNQRLEYELQQMCQHQELNREVKVSLVNQDDLSEWNAQLFVNGKAGEVNTINLRISFSPKYPKLQPRVLMKAPLIFHPDVNRQTGRVTLDDWQPQYTILNILLQLRETFSSVLNPSDSHQSPARDDYISAHTAKSSDLRAFARDFKQNHAGQGKMPANQNDDDGDITESMEAFEESGGKNDKGFMLFSRVKAGQEVEQKKAEKEVRIERAKQQEDEKEEELEEREGLEDEAEGAEEEDQEAEEIKNEPNQQNSVEIEARIQQKLRENSNSELIRDFHFNPQQNLEGNLNLQMFSSDLMDKNGLNTMESGQKKEDNFDIVDRSVKGVNNLIEKMKNDHAQPSQSRLKNQSNRQPTGGSGNTQRRLQQDSRTSTVNNPNQKRLEDINSFFNVRSNRSINSLQQSYLNQKSYGAGLGSVSQNDLGKDGKLNKDPMLQKHNAAKLAAGRSVVPTHVGGNTNKHQLFSERPKLPPTQFGHSNMGTFDKSMSKVSASQIQRSSNQASVTDFYGLQQNNQGSTKNMVKIQNKFLKSRPQSGKIPGVNNQARDINRLGDLQVSDQVGANSLQKLRTSLSSAGFNAKLVTEDGRQIGQAQQRQVGATYVQGQSNNKKTRSKNRALKRPASSKPPRLQQMSTTNSRAAAQEEYHMPQTMGSSHIASKDHGGLPQLNQHIDWAREYGIKVKDKAQRHRNKVFDIIDTQLEYGYNEPGTVEGLEELGEGMADAEDGSVDEEEIYDIRTDQLQQELQNEGIGSQGTIEKNQDYNSRSRRTVTFTEVQQSNMQLSQNQQAESQQQAEKNDRFKMYKSQGATGMMGRINKQRQARGGNSGFQRAALRRNIISQTTGSAERMSRQIEGSSIPQSNPLPPKIPGNKNTAKPKFLSSAPKHETRPNQVNARYLGGRGKKSGPPASKEEKEHQPPIGQLFQFDPSNMSKTDIVNIAENADNLIKIISNIKQQVAINSADDVAEQPEEPGQDDGASSNSMIRKGENLNEDLQFYDSRVSSEKKGRRFTQQIEIGHGFFDQNVPVEREQVSVDETAMTMQVRGQHSATQNQSMMESQTIHEDHQQIIESRPREQAWWD